MVIDYYFKPFVNHNSKFLIIASNKSLNVQRNLEFLSIVNYVVIYELNTQVLILANDGSNLPRRFKDLSSNSYASLYPEHSIVLKNQTHKIFVHQQPSKVDVHDGNVHSDLTHFLDLITKIDGSKFLYPKNPILDYKNVNLIIKEFVDFVVNRTYEMTLNNFVQLPEGSPRLMTYQQDQGFCVLVPKNSIRFYERRIEIMFLKVINL